MIETQEDYARHNAQMQARRTLERGLPINENVAFLKNRPLTKYICITGRSARPELIELADLFTGFEEVNHPFKAGFKAQKGVEY